ncbi:hypothetical protein AVEN_166213-1, partial [Araneus ventricosus]
MKEPLPGIHFNNREEVIRPIRQSYINRSRRADVIRRNPVIWQKVVDMRDDNIE